MTEEKDPAGRKTRSSVFLNTHKRTAIVFTRCCNMDEGDNPQNPHKGCRILYTGADEDLHRHSYSTIIGIEVALSAFDFFILAKGPGMQAFVDFKESEYTAAGSPLGPDGLRFLGIDTFRKCFDGIFSRTNFDANRPCFTCKLEQDPETGEYYSQCENLASDAQRVRTRRSQLRVSPTTVSQNSAHVDCRHYSQACERLAWAPGGPSTPNGKARLTLSALCSELLRHKSSQVGATSVDLLTLPNLEHLKATCVRLDSGISGYAPAVQALILCFNGRRAAVTTGTPWALSDFEGALSETMLRVAHSQTEATQLVPESTYRFLREIVHLSNGPGFSHTDFARWRKELGVRRSLVALAFLGHSAGGADLAAAIGGSMALNPIVSSLFSALADRVSLLIGAGAGMHQRQLIPEVQRPNYDPTRGEAYFFSQSGRPVAHWPVFSHLKSEHNCESCDHPDWYKKGTNGMSEGIMSVACLNSYTIRGFHFLLAHESKADAAAAIFCNSVFPPSTCTLDTPCQHAPYVNSRTGFFYGTQFMADRWHRLKHTCRLIFDPDEFRRFDDKNTSFIEQWHSLQMTLKKMVAGATMEHATFYACLLIDYHYNRRCDELQIPEVRRRWPLV